MLVNRKNAVGDWNSYLKVKVWPRKVEYKAGIKLVTFCVCRGLPIEPEHCGQIRAAIKKIVSERGLTLV